MTSNKGSLFDKRDDLGNMVLEKQRVKWLFSNYVEISGEDVAILNDCCKKLYNLTEKNSVVQWQKTCIR